MTTLDPLVSAGHVSFETAYTHAVADVPRAQPAELAGDVRQRMLGATYACASHLVVCADERFDGVVRVEDLLGADAATPVGALADRDAPFVAPGVDQEVAAWKAARHGESALCVVERSGRFVGLIPPHRLIAVLLSEHEEDLSRLGGFMRSTRRARATSEEPVERRFRHRLPWLLVGLGGALAAADLVGSFHARLQAQPMLAYFIPGIVYLADAVGTQTETVVVRGLSVGVRLRAMLARELLAGLAIGVALALVGGLAIAWRWQHPALAWIVGATLLAACATATVVAMLLPWLLQRLRFDPAFGSGPLATVIQDLVSIALYFAITAIVLG